MKASNDLRTLIASGENLLSCLNEVNQWAGFAFLRISEESYSKQGEKFFETMWGRASFGDLMAAHSLLTELKILNRTEHATYNNNSMDRS